MDLLKGWARLVNRLMKCRARVGRGLETGVYARPERNRQGVGPDLSAIAPGRRSHKASSEPWEPRPRGDRDLAFCLSRSDAKISWL